MDHVLPVQIGEPIAIFPAMALAPVTSGNSPSRLYSVGAR